MKNLGYGKDYRYVAQRCGGEGRDVVSCRRKLKDKIYLRMIQTQRTQSDSEKEERKAVSSAVFGSCVLCGEAF